MNHVAEPNMYHERVFVEVTSIMLTNISSLILFFIIWNIWFRIKDVVLLIWSYIIYDVNLNTINRFLDKKSHKMDTGDLSGLTITSLLQIYSTIYFL